MVSKNQRTLFKGSSDLKADDVAISIFRKATFPEGLSEDSAWLGIYQTLMWLEPVAQAPFKALPHIIDSDKLRPAKGKRPAQSHVSLVWPSRAQRIAQYLSHKLGVSEQDLEKHLGKLFRHPNWRGVQKQNPLGIGFVALTAYCLNTFVQEDWQFKTEQPAKLIFPDIKMTGRSKEPRIDILGIQAGHPRAVISCKWSIRHDRLGDVSTECTVYKSEALRNRLKLSYFLVTNEYDPARLNKILDDTCIDGIVHVHKPAVTEICELDGRLDDLFDLSEFFRIVKNLR